MIRTPVVLLILCACTSRAEQGTWFGYRLSRLHPGSSELLTATTLFQGQPNAVLGTEFGYGNPKQADFEEFLYVQLAQKPTKARHVKTDALWNLANGVYQSNEALVFICNDQVRKNYTQALRNELRTKKFAPRDELLLWAMLYYYVCPKPKSAEAKGMLTAIRNVKSTAASTIANNVELVGKRFRISRSKAEHENPIEIFR